MKIGEKIKFKIHNPHWKQNPIFTGTIKEFDKQWGKSRVTLEGVSSSDKIVISKKSIIK